MAADPGEEVPAASTGATAVAAVAAVVAVAAATAAIFRGDARHKSSLAASSGAGRFISSSGVGNDRLVVRAAPPPPLLPLPLPLVVAVLLLLAVAQVCGGCTGGGTAIGV